MVDSKVKIGVLSLQGDFIEHLNVLETLSIESLKVKTISDLNNVDGLIIPGGESTTIKKLIDRYGFEEPIKEKISHCMSVWGTCAGLICIAEKLSFNKLKSLVSQVDLLIGGDTGPVHMAWALNVPSITLFGSTPEFEEKTNETLRQAFTGKGEKGKGSGGKKGKKGNGDGNFSISQDVNFQTLPPTILPEKNKGQ